MTDASPIKSCEICSANLRLDPFEKMGVGDSLFAEDWWTFEFWRFVFVQQEVEQLAKTALEFPPMQPGASFNFEGTNEKIKQKIASRAGQQRRGLDF